MSSLRALRKQKGVTQQEVADYIGSSSQAYSRFEKGIFKPDSKKIKKLADYFDVSIDYIQSQFPLIIADNDRRCYEETLIKKYARQSVKNSFSNHFISFPIFGRIPADFDFNTPDSSLIDHKYYNIDIPFYYQNDGNQVFCFLNNVNYPNESLKSNDIIIACRDYRVKDGDLVVVNLNQNDAVIMRIKTIDMNCFLIDLDGNIVTEFIPSENLKYLGIVLEIKRLFIPISYLGYME